MPKISVEVPQRGLDARRRRVEVAAPLLSQSPAAPLGVRPRVRRCLPRLGLEQVPLHVQLQQLSFKRSAPRRVGLVARRREGRAVAGREGRRRAGEPRRRGLGPDLGRPVARGVLGGRERGEGRRAGGQPLRGASGGLPRNGGRRRRRREVRRRAEARFARRRRPLAPQASDLGGVAAHLLAQRVVGRA